MACVPDHHQSTLSKSDSFEGGEQLDKSIDADLFGGKGKLDSLGLVSFVVATEQEIEEEFGVPISIADERAMSQKNSPFKTLGTFADYISLLLEEDSDVR